MSHFKQLMKKYVEGWGYETGEEESDQVHENEEDSGSEENVDGKDEYQSDDKERLGPAPITPKQKMYLAQAVSKNPGLVKRKNAKNVIDISPEELKRLWSDEKKELDKREPIRSRTEWTRSYNQYANTVVKHVENKIAITCPMRQIIRDTLVSTGEIEKVTKSEKNPIKRTKVNEDYSTEERIEDNMIKELLGIQKRTSSVALGDPNRPVKKLNSSVYNHDDGTQPVPSKHGFSKSKLDDSVEMLAYLRIEFQKMKLVIQKNEGETDKCSHLMTLLINEMKSPSTDLACEEISCENGDDGAMVGGSALEKQ